MKKTIVIALTVCLALPMMGQQSTKRDALLDSLESMNKSMNAEIAKLTEAAKALKPEQSAEMEKMYVKYTQLVGNDKLRRLDLFLTHADSKALLGLLPEYAQVFDRDDAKRIYAKLPEAFKQDSLGKVVYNELFANDTALAIVHPDSSGKMLALESLRGKYVLVDFWASWCGPCMREVPTLRAAYAKYKAKGFEIYGISLDNERAKWLNAIRANQMNWVHTSDLKGWKDAVAVRYGIQSIPASFLLDPQGHLIAKDLRGDALMQKLERIFSSK
jgi:thiol-disulfide isomerase/thioredoxin